MALIGYKKDAKIIRKFSLVPYSLAAKDNR